MQVDIAVRLASIEKVHRSPTLRVLHQRDLLQLESEILRLGHLLQDLNYEVFIVEKRHVVQTSVIV